MQKLLLALILIPVLQLRAQDTHFIPVPKALKVYELPFDEKNQARIKLKTTEDLKVEGATTELTLPSTVSGTTYSVVCKLYFKSELFERRIPAGETYFLKEAVEKVKEAIPSTSSQKVKLKLKSSEDSEVPVDSMVCYALAKTPYRYIDEVYIGFKELSCILDVTIKAPINRTNPPINCSFNE